MTGWARLVPIAIVAMLGAPAAATPLLEDGAGHVEWIHRDNTFNIGGALLRANADAVPDVVTLSAHRGGYQQCFGAAPTAAAHLALDTVFAPSVKLSVLDGATGAPIWERSFDDGGLVGVRVTPQWFELGSSVHTGDLDGDGADDLLLLRTTKAADGSQMKLHRTMYDPATGTVRWTTERVAPANAAVIQSFVPIPVFGSPGGLMADMVITTQIVGTEIKITIDGDSSFVLLRPGALPEPVVTLPDEMGVVLPVLFGNGYRLLSFPTTIEGTPPNLQIISSVNAVDLALDDDDEPVFTGAWSRPGAGGTHWGVSGGSNPAVVVTRPKADLTGFVAVMNLADGADRWTRDLNVGPQGGSFLTADADADGVEDIIASPAFGATEPAGDPANVLAGGTFAEIHALDGRTGQPLYVRTDHLGKFRAWSLGLADVDGDARVELLAGLGASDGLVCSQPSDDPGVVGVYELSTGIPECRFHTDRFPKMMLPTQITPGGGQEVVVPTAGGNVWAFTNAEPGCGALGIHPLG